MTKFTAFPGYQYLFSGKFFILLDVNECLQEFTNQCHLMANCTNTDGSYNCTCVAGFTGSGKNCSGNYCSCHCLIKEIRAKETIKCVFGKIPKTNVFTLLKTYHLILMSV